MTEYYQWKSSLQAATVVKASSNFSYPKPLLDGVLFLRRSKQDSRSILTLEIEGIARDITPEGFNLRTTVNEYGGIPFWLDGCRILFSNLADQCLYQQSVSDKTATPPSRVSCLPSAQYRYSYADVNFLSSSMVVAIIEKQFFDNAIENSSFVGVLDLTLPDQEPIELHGCGDFHSNLVFHSRDRSLAWVQWDHPNMPWDNTNLKIAKIKIDESREESTNNVSLVQLNSIDTGQNCSICQLIFARNGTLFLSADYMGYGSTEAKNFWNIYALTPSAPSHIVPVTSELKEFGYPHWQFGNTRIVQYDENHMLSVASTELNDEVIVINQNTFEATKYPNQPYFYNNLSSNGQGTVFAERLANDSMPVISRLDDTTRMFQEVISATVTIDRNEVSVPKHISFNGRNGVAHGYYYPPVNHNYEISADVAPPLIVMVHGGPSARAYNSFDIQKQYWTQRGFAIFDVNHRGSSGYGRNYRDALYGAWGELDCSDIIDGVNFLVDKKLVNAGEVCIRGKSAGGFTVLRALTEYPDVFAAGACYYGIANLATLAEHTHKFEKYYTDRLIGEPFDKKKSAATSSAYYQRSPINNLQSLDSAMIIFQGAQDKVVPPSVAHELVHNLEVLGLPHTYIEYPDEGHGFRQVNNNINALEKEFEFYRVALKTSQSH